MRYNFVEPTLNVDFEECAPAALSQTEHGLEMTKVYRVAWADRLKLVRLLVGRRQRLGVQGTSTYVNVVEPHSFHGGVYEDKLDDQAGTRLYCRSANIRAWDDTKGGTPAGTSATPGAIPPLAGNAAPEAVCDYAEIEARYDDGPWFIEERGEGGGQMIGISGGPGKEICWRTGADKSARTVDRRVIRPCARDLTGQWIVIYHALRFVPIEVWTYRGKVNSVAISSNHFRSITPTGATVQREFAIGTVLYEKHVLSEVYLPWNRAGLPWGDGPYTRVELYFTIKESGHNKFWNPLLAAYDDLSLRTPGTDPPYDDTFQAFGTAVDLRALLGSEV